MELQASVRARWLGVFALSFGGLALGLSYFGMVHAGFTGFVGFTRTALSLLSLVTLLVPLVALVVGAGAFGGERETQQLLVAQPLTRPELVAGRFLGLLAALVAAQLLGFGLAGVWVALRAGSDGWIRYAAMVGLSWLLAASCLSLGTWIGVASRERAHALGAALAAWGGMVLVYDLVAMGVAVAAGSEAARPLLVAMVLANPVDLVRVMALLAIGARESLGGPGAALVAALQTFGGQILLPLAAAGWLGLPLVATWRAIEGQDF